MPFITINTNGLGDIKVIEPDNLKLKMLLDALKDHIEVYGVDNLETFLSGEGDTNNLKEEIKGLKYEISSHENEISELEDELNSQPDFNKIDCGIGTISYEADNIALEDIMENLDAAIQKTNFKKVNEVLSNI